MSRFSVILLLLAFLAVGIVGVSMMNSHSDCFFGKISSCAANAINMIDAHFNALGLISAAVFPTKIIFLISLVVLLLISAILINLFNSRIVLYRRYISFLKEIPPRFKREFYHWLSLHENSPSFFAVRT